MADFYICKGDRLPKIKANPLRNPDGTVCDVSGATSVKFEFRLQSGGSKTTGDAVVVSGVNGIVEYQFASDAFSTAGNWLGRFRVYWGTVCQCFPNKSYLVLTVTDEL